MEQEDHPARCDELDRGGEPLRRAELAYIDLTRTAAGRYRQYFVLLSTPGEHDPLRNDHKLKDAREVPIKLGGYAASFRGGHVQVRIERGVWKQLKAYYLDLATKRSVSWFESNCSAEFRADGRNRGMDRVFEAYHLPRRISRVGLEDSTRPAIAAITEFG